MSAANTAPSLPLPRSWIEEHLPHRGGMCLLDSVVEFDDDHAVCTSPAHRASDNPLRAHDALAAICAVEFAAQATAVHAELRTREPVPGHEPRRGMITSVRAIECRVERLDQLSDPLWIRVHCLQGDGRTALYRFEVGTAAVPASVCGRLALLLEAEPRP